MSISFKLTRRKFTQIILGALFVLVLVSVSTRLDAQNTTRIQEQQQHYDSIKHQVGTKRKSKQFKAMESLRANVLPNTFDDFTNGHESYWKQLNQSTIDLESKKIREFSNRIKVNTLGTAKRDVLLSTNIYKGRGIVYTSHHRLIASTLTSLRFLRHYGCTLPVEIWHLHELEKDDIAILERIPNVKVRDLSAINSDISMVRQSDGRLFIAKGAALIHSSFAQVLMLDADNMPAQGI